MKTIPSHLCTQLNSVFDAIDIGDIVNFDNVADQALCGKKARIASKSHGVVSGGVNEFDYIAFWIEKDNGQRAYIMVAATLEYDKAKRGVTFKGMLRNGAVVSGFISGFGV